jgi:hypothetical protein
VVAAEAKVEVEVGILKVEAALEERIVLTIEVVVTERAPIKVVMVAIRRAGAATNKVKVSNPQIIIKNRQ